MAVGALPRESGENLSGDVTRDLRLVLSPEEQEEKKARIKELAASMGQIAAELKEFPQDMVTDAYSETIKAARANSQDEAARLGRDALSAFLPEEVAEEIVLETYSSLIPVPKAVADLPRPETVLGA